MESIVKLFSLDIVSIIIGIFIVLSAIIAIYEIVGKISIIIGKPVKWVREKSKDHDLIVTTSKELKELRKRHEDDVLLSINHDTKIEKDLMLVSNKMDSLSEQIRDMQRKMDQTEMAKLKDSIVNYYKKYKELGEWTQLESDAFWDLFKRYEAHGGNGFVHSSVEPTMRDINIID